jgi:hypothetical protein
LVGISNVVLPTAYTFMIQRVSIVNSSLTTTPSFRGFISVEGY